MANLSKPLLFYLLFAYLITWSVTLTGYFLYLNHKLSLDQLNIFYCTGALGPFLSAILASKFFYGKTGIKKLFATFTFKSLNKKAVLISLSPVLFLCAGFLIYPLLSGHWYTFADTQKQFNLTTPLSYAGWILPFLIYSVFEEFGWRAFLLPHLQQNFSALKASFILTIFWSCWHLPFFLWRFQFSLFITFGFFFSIFIGALIITSIFNFSKGSIVPVIVFHLTNNIASALDKEYTVAVVSTCFVFLAIYILKKYKPENLCDKTRVKNFYLTAL